MDHAGVTRNRVDVVEVVQVAAQADLLGGRWRRSNRNAGSSDQALRRGSFLCLLLNLDLL